MAARKVGRDPDLPLRANVAPSAAPPSSGLWLFFAVVLAFALAGWFIFGSLPSP